MSCKDLCTGDKVGIYIRVLRRQVCALSRDITTQHEPSHNNAFSPVTKSGITLGFYTNSVKLKNTLKKDFYIITQRSQMGIYNNGSLALSRSIWPLVIFKESISSQIG